MCPDLSRTVRLGVAWMAIAACCWLTLAFLPILKRSCQHFWVKLFQSSNRFRPTNDPGYYGGHTYTFFIFLHRQDKFVSTQKKYASRNKNNVYFHQNLPILHYFSPGSRILHKQCLHNLFAIFVFIIIFLQKHRLWCL